MNIKYFFIIITQLHLALYATENKLNTHINQGIVQRLLLLQRFLDYKAFRKHACKKLQHNNPIPGERFIPGIGLLYSLIQWAVPPTINPLETKIRKDWLATERFIHAIGHHPVGNRRIHW